MRVTWLGHSCFKVESKGYMIVLDPYEDNSVPGCGLVRETADEVLCSHEHFDHNARNMISLREHGESPIKVTVISTYHDDKQGELRGNNKIHILDDGEVTIAHMGDLGCELEPEQLEQLKGLDAILEQLKPRVTIPMHYRGENFGFDVIGTLEEYTSQCSDVKTYPTNSLQITKDMEQQTAVLMMGR